MNALDAFFTNTLYTFRFTPPKVSAWGTLFICWLNTVLRIAVVSGTVLWFRWLLS